MLATLIIFYVADVFSCLMFHAKLEVIMNIDLNLYRFKTKGWNNKRIIGKF